MTRALIFAGQGAQFVGMGKDLAEAYPEIKAMYDNADEVLGRGLSSICFDGPDEELTKSNNCQPAIFVTSMACLKALELVSGKPERAAVAGLSLGEWSALCAGGALSFEAALKVLEARGSYMQEACEETEGGMISLIGLTVDQCKEIAEKSGVEIANLNSAQQTVLSGPKSGIADAEKLANEAGAKRAIVLNVAGAFHSSLMKSAAEKLAAFLNDIDITAPAETVLSNADGKPHTGSEEIKDAMVRQVHCSVRWLDCVEWMQANGVSDYIELGPGKVLSGLIKRIDRGATLNNIQDKATLDKVVESIG